MKTEQNRNRTERKECKKKRRNGGEEPEEEKKCKRTKAIDVKKKCPKKVDIRISPTTTNFIREKGEPREHI